MSNSGGGNNSGNSTGSVSGGLSNSGVNVTRSTSLGQGNGTTSSIDFYNVAVPKVPSTITGSSQFQSTETVVDQRVNFLI